MTHQSVVAVCVSFLATVAATAGAPNDADQWFEPTKVTVRTGMLPRQDFAEATMSVAKDHDAQVETSGFAGGKSYSGTLMLISGNYMVAKGVELSRGAEIDALDAPVLEIQTVMKLLARAVPLGPRSISNARQINISEAHEALEVATQSASGAYPAPWNVNGSVKRESPTSISFVLDFNFSGAERPLSFTGTWERGVFSTFLDSQSLVGWRTFHLGVHQSNQNGGTVMDYGAQEIPAGFATIGALRRYAKQHGGGA